MLLFDTYLASSPIEGVGVYATEFIPAGALIWTLNLGVDRIFTTAEFDALPDIQKAFLRRYAYYDAGLNGHLLDGDNARFLNHSETPNLDFREDGNGYAAVAIAPHEEITCDYNQFMGDVILLPSVVRPVHAM